MMQRQCQNYSKKCFPTSKIPATSIHVLCQNMHVRPHQRSDRTHSSTSIFKKLQKKLTAALDCTENVTGMKTEYSIVSFN